MTKFTQEQLDVIEVAAYKLYTRPGRTNPDDLIAEIAKSDWCPPKTQVIRYQFDGGGVTFGRCGLEHGLSRCRPLTTKEAGPECMQHLIDALKEIDNAYGWSLRSIMGMANKALATHLELVK